ncbi:MAG TPA: hypothetical protein VLD37_02375 [Candidatus Bilamarchaeum sp.]|nr:hypothetical protein [Candidatus Bilamarchaeum sp.]
MLGFLQKLSEIRSLDRAPAYAIAEKASERLLFVVKSASTTSFYSELLKERPIAGIEDLREFPLTEKAAVRGNPNLFLSRGSGMHLPSVTTSGSSGIPTRVYLDREAIDYRNALIFFIGETYGARPFDLYLRIDSASPSTGLRPSSIFGLYPSIAMSALCSEQAIYENMRRRNARIVSCYPSVAELLARLNSADSRPHRLKFFVGGGEMLSERARHAISESFRCPVYDYYGCWEFGTMATMCPEEGTLHVNGSVILETVDGKGRPVSGTGEIVATSLVNRAMPLLRYSLGDIGSLGSGCPCGRTSRTLKRLEGRSDDLIVLPSGRIRSPWSFNVVGLDAVKDSVSSFRIVQKSEELFVFQYVPASGALTEPMLASIGKRIMDAALGEPVRVEFEECASLPRDRGGKLRRVISEVRRPKGT